MSWGYLVVEGMDYAGKTTFREQLSQALDTAVVKHVNVREPGGTPVAELIREVILKAESNEIDNLTMLYVMHACRANVLNQVIAPNIEAGIPVLSDRNIATTYAYQGIDELSRLLFDGFFKDTKYYRQPDVFIYVDIMYPLYKERLDKDGAIHPIEIMSEELFNQRRNRYLEFLTLTAKIYPDTNVIVVPEKLADYERKDLIASLVATARQ